MASRTFAHLVTIAIAAQLPAAAVQVPVQPSGKIPALVDAAPGVVPGPVVIDFEDQTTAGPGPGPLVLTDQYAARGVTFNRVFVLDYSKGLAIPDFARGTRAIEQCYGIEFCQEPIAATFAVPQARVKVWVGYSSRHDAGRIVMTARDAAGEVIDRRVVSVPAGDGPAPIDQAMEMVDASARIARVEIAGVGLSPSGVAVDDLEFERQVPTVPATETPVSPPSQDSPAPTATSDPAAGSPSAPVDVPVAPPPPPRPPQIDVLVAAGAFLVLGFTVARLVVRKPGTPDAASQPAAEMPGIRFTAHSNAGTATVTSGQRAGFDVRIRVSSGPAAKPAVIEGAQHGLAQKEYL